MADIQAKGPGFARVFAGSQWGAGQPYENGLNVKNVCNKPYTVAVMARADCVLRVKQASWDTNEEIFFPANVERALQVTQILAIVSGTPGYIELIF